MRYVPRPRFALLAACRCLVAIDSVYDGPDGVRKFRESLTAAEIRLAEIKAAEVAAKFSFINSAIPDLVLRKPEFGLLDASKERTRDERMIAILFRSRIETMCRILAYTPQ